MLATAATVPRFSPDSIIPFEAAARKDAAEFDGAPAR